MCRWSKYVGKYQDNILFIFNALWHRHGCNIVFSVFSIQLVYTMYNIVFSGYLTSIRSKMLCSLIIQHVYSLQYCVL